MTWFEELMDDSRQALALIWVNPWIALPYVLHLLVAGLITVVFAVIFLGLVAFSVFLAVDSPGPEILIILLISALFGLIAPALILTALKALVDSGSLNLFSRVAKGEKPQASLFWEGVRCYFLSIWGITLFLYFIVFITSPIILGLLIVYIPTVGILSGGWGLVLIAVMLTVFFSAWPVALVLDNRGGFKALGSGIRLLKRYFRGMLVLGLASLLIGQYVSTAFGFMLAFLVGWIAFALVSAWFKMTLLLIYKRRREING